MRKIIIALTVILALLLSSVTCFAAADPHVVIINPNSNSTISANSLLISIKVTQPKTIAIKVYEEKASGGSVVKATDTFTSVNNLSYYTRQLTDLSPGVYRIHVDTLNSAGKVAYSIDKYVTLKKKADNTAEVNVFDTPKSGTSAFLQNLLKGIFGS